jgi:uncharacterized RDD family membrane protein YckC
MTAGMAFLFFSGLSAVFGVVYLPMLMRQPKAFISPYPKADVRKRAASAIADGMLLLIFALLAATQNTILFVGIGAVYVLLRDALFIPGQSVGKFLFGLRVINLGNGRPCGRLQSAQRNFILVVPGLNVVALALEAVAVPRDPQGQRLGDKLANTQVIEGFGAREFMTSFQRALLDGIEMGRERGKQPVEVK